MVHGGLYCAVQRLKRVPRPSVVGLAFKRLLRATVEGLNLGVGGSVLNFLRNNDNGTFLCTKVTEITLVIENSRQKHSHWPQRK